MIITTKQRREARSKCGTRSSRRNGTKHLSVKARAEGKKLKPRARVDVRKKIRELFGPGAQ